MFEFPRQKRQRDVKKANEDVLAVERGGMGTHLGERSGAQIAAAVPTIAVDSSTVSNATGPAATSTAVEKARKNPESDKKWKRCVCTKGEDNKRASSPAQYLVGTATNLIVESGVPIDALKRSKPLRRDIPIVKYGRYAVCKFHMNRGFTTHSGPNRFKPANTRFVNELPGGAKILRIEVVEASFRCSKMPPILLSCFNGSGACDEYQRVVFLDKTRGKDITWRTSGRKEDTEDKRGAGVLRAHFGS